MKRVGILGVGEIGRAIVEGLYARDGEEVEVFLSPRGSKAAAELSRTYQGASVCRDNQSVVGNSELVIIAVRRADHREALGGLSFAEDKIVVNLMAGVSNDDLRHALAMHSDTALVRAIPLPAIRERHSLTVTYPSHPVVDSLFTSLGGALPVADEAAFDVLSAVTGTLSTHLQYLATVTAWAIDHGIPTGDADRYVRRIFAEVGCTLRDATQPLAEAVTNHETPRGNNEQIRTIWFTPENASALTAALDGLLAELARPCSIAGAGERSSDCKGTHLSRQTVSGGAGRTRPDS